MQQIMIPKEQNLSCIQVNILLTEVHVCNSFIPSTLQKFTTYLKDIYLTYTAALIYGKLSYSLAFRRFRQKL